MLLNRVIFKTMATGVLCFSLRIMRKVVLIRLMLFRLMLVSAMVTAMCNIVHCFKTACYVSAGSGVTIEIAGTSALFSPFSLGT